MPVRSTLKSTLTAYFMMAACLPLMLAGTAFLHFFSVTLEKEITGRNFLMAKAMAGEVNRFLSDYRSLLEYTAEQAGTLSLQTPSKPDNRLEAMLLQYSLFENLKLLDTKGIVRTLAPFRQDQTGLDMSGYPFVRKAMSDGAPVWSDVYLSPRSGDPVISLAVPSRSDIVVGDMNLGILQDISREIINANGAYAVMVDRDGTVIADPDPVAVSQRANMKDVRVVRHGLAGEEGSFQYRSKGEKQIGSVAIVPQTGWLLIIIQPENRAFAVIHQGKRLLWTVIVAIAVAVLVVFGYFLRKAVAPLLRLTDMTRKISCGDYHIESLPAGYPEIERLADDFKFMAEAINARETELRQSREQVQRSEKRLRDIYDSVSDFIYTQDMNGRLLSVNRAMADLFEYAPEELVGHMVSDFMKPALRHLFETEYLVQLKATGRHQGVFVCYTKNKRKVYIDYVSTITRSDNGEIFISGIGRDVTERMTAERAIRKMEASLLHAQKMEAIGTLAGGVAHDFNNLMMAIQGNISLMLLDSGISESVSRRLKDIDHFVQQGASLTRQLLGFAKGGKYEVRPVNLNELLREYHDIFGRTRKDICIREDYDPALWNVAVDSGQMGQVLMNLYINAAHAMLPDGGNAAEISRGNTIRVCTENVWVKDSAVYPFDIRPGRYVHVSVADTGVGMDESTRRRIFEPFFTTREMGRGTGLGLASVYGIIKNHGGCIDVQSQPGRGTVFHLYLPAVESQALTPDRTEAPGAAALSCDGVVLLVDDEEMILDVGRQMLEHMGWRVSTASNAHDAVSIYSERHAEIVLVILDMIMPESGGGVVFDQLKAIDPNVNVLLSSGYSIDGQAQAILERGCRGFLQKPFNLQELNRKIGEILVQG